MTFCTLAGITPFLDSSLQSQITASRVSNLEWKQKPGFPPHPRCSFPPFLPSPLPCARGCVCVCVYGQIHLSPIPLPLLIPVALCARAGVCVCIYVYIYMCICIYIYMPLDRSGAHILGICSMSDSSRSREVCLGSWLEVDVPFFPFFFVLHAASRYQRRAQ